MLRRALTAATLFSCVIATLVAVAPVASATLVQVCNIDSSGIQHCHWEDDGSGTTPPTNGGGTTGGHCEYNGHIVHCYVAGLGQWNGTCYIEVQTPQDPPPSRGGGVNGQEPGGTWWLCTQPGGTPQPYWVPTRVPPPPPVPPQDAAYAVIATMDLSPAGTGMVPDPEKPGAVGLPIWFWANRGATNWDQNVTKTQDGYTITVHAYVEKVTYDLGDSSRGGHPVTCEKSQLSMPYADSYGTADSPVNCGYRYQKTSQGMPGDVYTITETTYWGADWTGGGQGNHIDRPGVTTTVRTLEVGELQALIGTGH